MSVKKAIIIIGPPGSGKGTQARILAEKLGYFHFEISKALRQWIEEHSGNTVADEAKEQYKSGRLVDEDVLAESLIAPLDNILKDWPGIIYDSAFTKREIEMLWPVWESHFGKEIVVVFLNVPFDNLHSRLQKRLICQQRHTYIDGQDGLTVGKPCPKDGTLLAKRDLDEPEIIEERFNEFKNKVLPAIEFLRQKGVVVEINGSKTVEQVAREIGSKIK